MEIGDWVLELRRFGILGLGFGGLGLGLGFRRYGLGLRSRVWSWVTSLEDLAVNRKLPSRGRANSAQTTKSRPDSGLDLSHFRQKSVNPFKLFSFSLGREWMVSIYGPTLSP